jgi:proline utilization trans-activator
MIGSAMRLAILLGLHHNLPSYIKIDPLLKQHRNCLWYTVYTCDRMWASKVGYPLGTQDSDFSVDLPSLDNVPEQDRSELPNPAYTRASTKLASIAGDVINTIYCRSNPSPFIQSVQRVLRALQSWVAELPLGISPHYTYDSIM